MTLETDTSEYIPPSKPRRSQVLTPVVWAWMASCVVCLALGVSVAVFGPKLFPPPASPAETAEPQRPIAAEASPAPAPTTAPATPANPETQALSARLDRLEYGHRALAEAAASALAAANLSQAAETGRPFSAELTMLARTLPETRDLSQLRPLAERGAPTRAVLAAEFPEMARRASFAAKAPPDGSSLIARLNHALSVLFTVRQVNRLKGGDPDAVLARAERRVNDGDLEGAVRELDALPPKGQAAAKDWVDRARSRAEVERQISGIRIQALRSLAAADREAGL